MAIDSMRARGDTAVVCAAARATAGIKVRLVIWQRTTLADSASYVWDSNAHKGVAHVAGALLTRSRPQRQRPTNHSLRVTWRAVLAVGESASTAHPRHAP